MRTTRSRFPRIALGVTLAMASVCPVAATPSQTNRPATASADSVRSLLGEYCLTCHNDRTRAGDRSFQALDPANVQQGSDAAIWEQILQRLRAESMPPPGTPRPDRSAYALAVAWLEAERDRASTQHPQLGRMPAFLRLTRTEYQTAVRDL